MNCFYNILRGGDRDAEKCALFYELKDQSSNPIKILICLKTYYPITISWWNPPSYHLRLRE